MENELIYAIGEVMIMELDEIENISYPQDYEPNSFKIETKNGKIYQVIIKVI
jgi:hypothetical protein